MGFRQRLEGKVFPMKREKEQKAKAWGRDAHSTSGNHKWEKFTVSLKAWSRVWRERLQCLYFPCREVALLASVAEPPGALIINVSSLCLHMWHDQP